MEDGPAPRRQHRREATPMPPPPPQPKGREEDVSRAAGAAPWKEPSRGSRGFCEGRTEAGGRGRAGGERGPQSPAAAERPPLSSWPRHSGAPIRTSAPEPEGEGAGPPRGGGPAPGASRAACAGGQQTGGPRRRSQDALRPCAVSRGRGRRCCRRGRSTAAKESRRDRHDGHKVPCVPSPRGSPAPRRVAGGRSREARRRGRTNTTREPAPLRLLRPSPPSPSPRPGFTALQPRDARALRKAPLPSRDNRSVGTARSRTPRAVAA